MDVRIDDLIRSFHETADDSKQQLQSVLALISEGKVPDAPAMSRINATVDKLREQYTDVCQAAAYSLPAEEMPQEGSPADVYAEAVKNSKFLEYRKQLDEMRKTLERFASVQSLAEMYAAALAPYQNEAKELMRDMDALSSAKQSDVEAFQEKTAGPAAFLKALACPDYDTDENWEMLDTASAYYPRKVQSGLSGRRYFLPESADAFSGPEECTPVLTPAKETVEEVVEKTAEETMAEPAEKLLNEPDEKPVDSEVSPVSACETVADAAETVTDTAAVAESASVADPEMERWHKLGIDDPQVYLYPVPEELLTVESSKKAGTSSSAKKFTGEFMHSTCRREMAATLRDAWILDCVEPSMLMQLENGDLAYVTACEQLYDLGYLQKYQLEGYPGFYTLTKRGEQICAKEKTTQLLGINPRDKGVGGTRNQSTASSALNRVLYLHAFGLGCIGGKKSLETSRIADDSFCLHFRYKEKDFGCFWAGIIGQSPESFELLTRKLAGWGPENFGNNAALIVLGVNWEHAHRMAEFVDKNLRDTLRETLLCYYDYETETCYRYADDTVMELAELCARSEPEPASESAPESAPEPAPESASESVPESAPESASESVPEPASEPAPESAPESALEPASESVSEPVPEPVSESVSVEKQQEAPVEHLQERAEPAASRPAELHQQTLNDPQREEHLNVLREMLAEEKFYCAAAYLRALSGMYRSYRSQWEQLSYALNDPAAHCNYISAKIINTYFYDNTNNGEALVIAAALRNFFYDQRNYDSQTNNLYSLLLGNPLLELYPELKNVLYLFKDFKIRQQHGYDRYADYRQKNLQRFDAEKKQIVDMAQRYYEANVVSDIHEKSSNERFVESRKLIFKNREYSFLPEALEFVSKGGTDPEYLDVIRLELQENYMRDDCEVSRENIDAQKLGVVLDQAWEKAAKLLKSSKRSERLIGDLRAKLNNRLQECVATLADYVSLLQNKPEVNEQKLIAARRCRQTLLQALDEALNCCGQMDDSVDAAILRRTLSELHDRMTGAYAEGDNRYFYQDFLRGNGVLLDEKTWLPVLDEIPIVENFSILNRIAEHSREDLPDFETRLQNIRAGEDDYGSGRMILKLLERTCPELDLTQFDLEESMKYADERIDVQRENFLGDLALAQSEGQITDDEQKEAYATVTFAWYLRTKDNNNYGFFRRLMDAIRASIAKEAASRASTLNQNLEAYLAENRDWESSEDIRAAVQRFREDIKVQNYAAAEDQLNRLKSNDLSTYVEPSGVDELERFLNEYQTHLLRVSRDRSKTLQYQLSQYNAPRNKESRGAERLRDSWPKNQPVTSDKIQTFMENLGFRVERVDDVRGSLPQGTMFNVFLKHAVNGVPVNYTHPIYIFGSQAETSGFQVVCLFGRFDAETLMEKMDSLGSTQNTLLLLDYSLMLQERRKLARLSKKKGTSSKTIAVIDRVVMSYLVQHYSETSINRMLMSIIIPFASFQPYIPDSSRVMPPEIFIGRRNELEMIKSPNGPNIVYGGRQLGKSALLKKAQKDIDHDQNGDRAVLVEIKNLDYRAAARKITETLYDEGILAESDITEDWSSLSRSIRNRLRSSENRIPYFMLLLDEADIFIESCEAVNYEPFDALKEIQSMEANRFKFIVAGLRNVVRFNKKVLANNSVLPHMSSLTVKPFNSVEATELLEMPLRYLGFRFERDDETQRLIATILNTTNYFPGMLQLYCAKLIEAMQYNYAGYDENKTPPYRVSRDHIKKTLADDTLRNQISEKIDITLHVGDDNYYYLIALLGAFHYYNFQSGSFSAEDIWQEARDYDIVKLADLKVDSINALMEEMRELNMLQSVRNGYYRFARENIRVEMGSSREEVDNKILEVAGNE